MPERLRAFFDKRPALKEKVARTMFRTRLLMAQKPSSKARIVGYDHALLRDALRDNANKNGRELHSLMHLQHVLGALRVLNREPEGEILEIGAGRAGLPVLLLLCGFARVHVNEISNAVNRFDRAHLENLQVMASLLGVGRRKLSEIVVPLDSTHCAIRPELLRVHAFTDASQIDIPPGSLSAVVSFTVLEHLRDPRRVFAHLKSRLAPDGWMCHVVDMRDHEDFADPLRFLAVSASEYQNRVGEWCNRLRHGDFVELFDETGFDVSSARVSNFNELDDRKSTDFWKMMSDGLHTTFRTELAPADAWVTCEMKDRLHPDFSNRTRTDLSILHAEYVVRARRDKSLG